MSAWVPQTEPHPLGGSLAKDPAFDGLPDALVTAAAIALRCSPFAARAVTAELGPGAAPDERLTWLARNAVQPWDHAAIERHLQTERGARPRAADVTSAAGPLGSAMRRVRRRLLMGLMVRDVAGQAALSEVTAAMTALAESCVRHALGVLAPELATRYGIPVDDQGQAQDLLVVAMGKGGAMELNVSSDLDLIFVYDAEGFTSTDAALGPASPGGTAPPAAGSVRSVSNQEFFERLGRALISMLSEMTADGFVFRVDMRLRPNGDAGPLVVSSAMLEEYLARQGREWERFAWLKGRVISEPVLADAPAFARQVAALEACIRPFVYRRYLDFNAISALRELHTKIGEQAQRLTQPRARPGEKRRWHVKIGRGGIREIEFIAQMFQIMRGGRDARLRSRSTIATLCTLGSLDLLPPGEAAALERNYVFLRRLEHALQYVDDAQTHWIPAETASREGIARLLGMQDADALMAGYQEAAAQVAGVFDRIFAAPLRAQPPGNGDPATALTALGFSEPAANAERIAALLGSSRLASLSEGSRTRVGHLLHAGLPLIVEEARRIRHRAGASADQILTRWLRLIEVIAGRSTYVALLDEYVQARERVVRLLAAGEWAAEYLARHPIVLDELLDDRVALQAPQADSVRQWVVQIRDQMAEAGQDGERLMNLLRDAHHAQVFRLLLAEVNGVLRLEALADHLSALADAVLELSLAAVWRLLRGEQAPAPRMAIVAYGKLGGKELGYASDLDLTFVFDDPDPEAPVVYAQLVRRLVSWLSTPTSSGVLFDVDLRLRPNGNAGLLITTFEAFEQYMRNTDGRGAWVWEHQALTRARACAGDAALGARFERLRRDVLARPRERAPLVDDVVSMRERMLAGHPNRSELFDLKHDRGGMVDVEFAVQFLVLSEAARHPQLLDNLGNIGLLRVAASLSLISEQAARGAADAYREYRHMQHGLRLDAAVYARVPRDEVQAQIDAVLRLWREVLGTDRPLPGSDNQPRPPRS